MLGNRLSYAVAFVFLVSAPALAQTPDILQGKYGFNWHSDPGREKCVRVEGKLLADFKSTRYRCDLKARSNTASGASARVCTEVKGRREYLVLDTLRACENERKTQASNE